MPSVYSTTLHSVYSKYIEEPKPRVDELNTDIVAELEAPQGEKLEEACSDSDSAPALPTVSIDHCEFLCFVFGDPSL